MLDRVNIRGLFGLYNYDIDLRKGSDDGIHFLTAPNGYGKTTILDMIASVVQGDFRPLMDIPFKRCFLSFDADASLAIDRYEDFPEIKEDSDEFMKPHVKLSISLYRKQEMVEGFGMDEHSGDFDNSFSNDFKIDDRGANIDMFLRSMICHYITDARILEAKSDERIAMDNLSSIDMRKYSHRVKEIMNDPIETEKYSDCLSFFKETIDSLVFSNKRIELQPAFGFRFVASDVNKTIISLSKLSSGEKHLLIQLCELLFMTKKGALVLIDEPELSLHMAWQYQYMTVIKGIVSLCGYQFLIATHSPQIFNAEWSRTTDLYQIAKVEKDNG